jgi:hypothetical protein
MEHKFKPSDRVKVLTPSGYATGTFVEYVQQTVCAIVQDDASLTGGGHNGTCLVIEDRLEYILPLKFAASDPHILEPGDRVWLHLCGEIIPGSFRKYTGAYGNNFNCIVERDDCERGNSKKYYWVTHDEFLEHMMPKEDPRATKP